MCGRCSDGMDLSGGRQMTRRLVWNGSPSPVLDPTRAGRPFRFCSSDRWRVGVKEGEVIVLEEEGEDDFHLKIGKMHPGAAVYAPSKPNQAMRLARLIVLRGEPFRTILVRVRKYLRHPMREGWCRKHHGVLRNAEALPGKSLSGLAHQGEGDRMEPLGFFERPLNPSQLVHLCHREVPTIAKNISLFVTHRLEIGRVLEQVNQASTDMPGGCLVSGPDQQEDQIDNQHVVNRPPVRVVGRTQRL